ncbi:MAG: SDR family oxidoreductase [Candidatus Nanopelagicales bacterium]|jgi:3-oxoacyl-[acyl-carrier protein] reductase
MDLGLDGRRYVVTAASRGLGFATAAALAADGAHTIIAARPSAALDAALAALGPRAAAVPVDLTGVDAAERIAEAVGSEPLDGVLVNVGGPAAGRALEYSDEQWQRAFEQVTLTSLRIIRTLVPRLADGASILIVLSSTVKEPIDVLAASNVLRPGLAMLVKDLANELAPRGVRVNGILPGKIATDRLLTLTGGTPEGLAAVEADIPMNRLGSPQEFGEVAAFLLSPAASYVTGVLVPVDGGLLRSPW